MFHADYGYNEYGLTRLGAGNSGELDSLGLSEHMLRKQTGKDLTAGPVSASKIVSPSEMLAIGDGFSGNKTLILDMGGNLSRNLDWNNDSFNQKYLDYRQIMKWVYARHQGKANMVFCDGHVETLTLKYLFADTSDEALSRWNRDHQPHRERLLP